MSSVRSTARYYPPSHATYAGFRYVFIASDCIYSTYFSILFGLNPDQPVKVQPSIAQTHPILSDLARTRTLLHVTLTRPFAVYTTRSEHSFLDCAFKFLLPNTRCVGTYHRTLGA
jgi:hypothetical protein